MPVENRENWGGIIRRATFNNHMNMYPVHVRDVADSLQWNLWVKALRGAVQKWFWIWGSLICNTQ